MQQEVLLAGTTTTTTDTDLRSVLFTTSSLPKEDINHYNAKSARAVNGSFNAPRFFLQSSEI